MLLTSFDSGKQQGRRKKQAGFFKLNYMMKTGKLIIPSLCDKSFFMTYFLSFSYFPVFYWGCLLKWLQAMTREIIGVYQTVFSVHVNTVFSRYKTSVAIQWLEQWFRSHTMFLKNLSFSKGSHRQGEQSTILILSLPVILYAIQ